MILSLASFTYPKNIDTVLMDMKTNFFCFCKNFWTYIMRVKTEYFSARVALHMFMVAFFTALNFIAFSICSEVNTPKNSYFSKEFECSKYTCATNIRKCLNNILTLKNVETLHFFKKFHSFGSDFFVVGYELFLDFHILRLSIN